ncbi:MAG: methylated-DNA--[protein]-cysteine S-methyltransferase [Fimbriimonadaceae bacterium]|nr:methylated-DNA--[protein]-cysteine S-methyltransferase [Fimbriimonadaceae bacterium]QYK54957.1 MAG: methylated-DNA--[protein]-cysteine S-methyltransferase [Fimbriimonadaceae bacterium]
MNTGTLILSTPIGSILLEATERGLSAVTTRPTPTEPSQGCALAKQHLDRASKQLEEYFQGARKAFDLELDLRGSEFQRLVWAELCRIPYGQTVSYSELAGRIGRPSASRAVGLANSQNPIAIVVPCHRVIGKNGKLVGYAGGLEIKSRLLALEGAGNPILFPPVPG